MALIREFLAEIDARWKPLGGEPISLQVIGSTALMLQTDYDRGTKDSDVLESAGVSGAVGKRLLALAGKETDIEKQFRSFIRQPA